MKQFDTLSETVEDLHRRGYLHDFSLRSDGLVFADNKDRCILPENFKIVEAHRFEGPSDPADLSVVYAIETSDGEKGILVDGYGIYNDDLNEAMILKMRINPETNARRQSKSSNG